jgi:hypothetical protein
MHSKDLLPGVPLIESPLADPDDPAWDLDDAGRQVARDLQTRGYAVIDFPDPDFPARAMRIRARHATRFGVDLADPASDKTVGERRLQDLWKEDEDVRAIATNPALLALLAKLWGRGAWPFQTLTFPVGTQQAAHSDSLHFSSLPPRFMCGVWVAMEDVDGDSGPLEYVPGSHAWPIVDNAMIGRRGWQSDLASAQDPYGPAWSALVAQRGGPVERFHARKGQALIWCANLLHGGAPQLDPRRTRWSQVTHYFFDDCIYYTPAFSDEALGRLQLRQLTDIASGQTRANTYLGEVVGPPPSHRPLKSGRLRKLARKIGKWGQA